MVNKNPYLQILRPNFQPKKPPNWGCSCACSDVNAYYHIEYLLGMIRDKLLWKDSNLHLCKTISGYIIGIRIIITCIALTNSATQHLYILNHVGFDITSLTPQARNMIVFEILNFTPTRHGDKSIRSFTQVSIV